jgi:hypothetical protein
LGFPGRPVHRVLPGQGGCQVRGTPLPAPIPLARSAASALDSKGLATSAEPARPLKRRKEAGRSLTTTLTFEGTVKLYAEAVELARAFADDRAKARREERKTWALGEFPGGAVQ